MAKKTVKRAHAADSANLFVRNLLCEISNSFGGFNETDWKKTKKYFGNRCAYTGATKNLVMDHVIAQNRTHCGLQRYGNIIPASKEANASKSGKTPEEFFNSDALCLRGVDKKTRLERLDKINAFQKESGYQELVKILDAKIKLKDLMQESYQQILDLADEKLENLSTLFDKETVLKVSVDKSVNEKIKMLKLWSTKPDCKHHKIIARFLESEPVKRGDFIDILAKKQPEITNPYGSVASMMSDAGHSYGRVFMEDEGELIICPELDKIVRSLIWKIL
ncbi:hypothetical protein SAMD00024442_187_2 [Candidatus Symbiothrix dinenymphae]|nr:hypothetical protein SAMD00024442_187_2 [Candidatus Symbiothrix dinenymphae]